MKVQQWKSSDCWRFSDLVSFENWFKNSLCLPFQYLMKCIKERKLFLLHPHQPTFIGNFDDYPGFQPKTTFLYYYAHDCMYKTIITYFCPWLGWEGKTCDENINECDGNPCLNGGMCMDTPGSFVCGCPFGKQTYLIYINNNILSWFWSCQL